MTINGRNVLFSSGYHIIVVPENVAKTRRFRISQATARLLTLGGMLAVPLVIGSFLLAVTFQNDLVVSKRKLAENRQVLEEKEIIAMRLAGLERSISKLEQSLGSLEYTMDLELGEMERGLGPIPEEVSLGNSERPSPEGGPSQSIMEQEDFLSLSTLHHSLNDLSDRIAGLSGKIDEIYELNADKIRFLQSNPTSLPVEGWITSDFGVRKSPYSRGYYRMHYGIDIASPVGTAVKAPADGKILFADYRGGYGRMIVLDHGYGLTTVYAHASQLFVKKGDEIKRGTIIAASGSSGASTGPHLHYEVHVDGIPADPLNFVVQ